MGSLINSCFLSCCFRRPSKQKGHIRLPDDEEDQRRSTKTGPTVKRRALLVGINYTHGQSDSWWPLENPHKDVDSFRNLLVGVYSYSPEDITVLKDDPNIPELLQPTRANIIYELTRLVSDAAPGDKFIFFYSGHSDQQLSFDDIGIEEDGQDEVIITSDLKRIVDNELNDILVKPLPIGCSLAAVLDTCHSETLLDLPHNHCNSVYVPWLSKGQRAPLTVRNNIARHYTMGRPNLLRSVYPLPSVADVIARTTDNTRCPPELLPSLSPRLRIDTQVGGNEYEENLFWKSIRDLEAYPAYEAHPPQRDMTPTRLDSPVSNVVCDGWCRYDPVPGPVVVSLSACADVQRIWEGPRGSLTNVLCKYLAMQPCPSYRKLMSHVGFTLYENARELHKYTREQKKKGAGGEGTGFDGELDNFQGPTLSSLSKLNMDDIFRL